MTDLRWDRISPSEECISPDGHDHVDVITGESSVPITSVCLRCSQPWQIVLVPGERSDNEETL